MQRRDRGSEPDLEQAAEDDAPASDPDAPGSGVVGPDADDSEAPEPNEPA